MLRKKHVPGSLAVPMDRIFKMFKSSNHENAREDFDALLKKAAVPAMPKKAKPVDTHKFAEAVVGEFGETLVLLSKE